MTGSVQEISSEVGELIVENTAKIVEGQENTAWLLKADELAVEKRLRYKSTLNEILGLCAQHATENDVVFNNAQQAVNLENYLKLGRLHLATESCVFALPCPALGTQIIMKMLFFLSQFVIIRPKFNRSLYLKVH